MKRIFFFSLLALSAAIVFGQTGVALDEYFIDKAMRVDLYLIGDAREELPTLDHIYQEGTWPENPDSLIEPFENGSYAVKIYDIASNRLIYSRGFSCMFSEYKTTTPSLNGIKRAFERSVRFPFPRRPVLFVLETRDKNNLMIFNPKDEFCLVCQQAISRLIDYYSGSISAKEQSSGKGHR